MSKSITSNVRKLELVTLHLVLIVEEELEYEDNYVGLLRSLTEVPTQ